MDEDGWAIVGHGTVKWQTVMDALKQTLHAYIMNTTSRVMRNGLPPLTGVSKEILREWL